MDEKTLFDYRWGSNRPTIKTIMEFFDPSGVLELGMGRYSTPLFYQYNKPLTSIETDGSWIETVKELVPPRDNVNLIHHKVEGIHYKTKHNLISNEVKRSCVEFYKTYITPAMEFLFVDHVSGLRASSLLGLFDKFKYIAYHDAEPKQYKNYNYQILIKEKTKDYIHFVSQPPLVHTGIMIHKDYESKIQDFISMLHKNNKEYCDGFSVAYEEVIRYM